MEQISGNINEYDGPICLIGKNGVGKSSLVSANFDNVEFVYLPTSTAKSLLGDEDYKPGYISSLENGVKENRTTALYLEKPDTSEHFKNISTLLGKKGKWKIPDKTKVFIASNKKISNRLIGLKPLELTVHNPSTWWIKRAILNGIEPSIITFVSMYQDEFNAFPLTPYKWEKASLHLQKSGDYESLKALLGNECYERFRKIIFETKTLSVNDVLNGLYDEEYINSLTDIDKKRTMYNLLTVSEEDFGKVHEFIRKFLGENLSLKFDKLWCCDLIPRINIVSKNRALDSLIKGALK